SDRNAPTPGLRLAATSTGAWAPPATGAPASARRTARTRTARLPLSLAVAIDPSRPRVRWSPRRASAPARTTASRPLRRASSAPPEDESGGEPREVFRGWIRGPWQGSGDGASRRGRGRGVAFAAVAGELEEVARHPEATRRLAEVVDRVVGHARGDVRDPPAGQTTHVMVRVGAAVVACR